MNKLAVVLGVAAVATLAGCKDPEYARVKPAPQNEAKSVETEAAPEAKQAEEQKAEEQKVEEIKEETPKCTCAPGTRHDKPCECGAPDCQCVVETKPVEPEHTIYIVQRGDYLAKISKKYNIKVDAIKKLNGMKSDKVRLGQKIKLPGKIDVGEQTVPEGAVKKAPAKKTYESYKGETKEYVVVAGDTLGKIAYSNGMNIRQLKELNGLKKDIVRVGQKLKVAADKPAEKKAETKPAEDKPAEVKSAAPAEEAKPSEEAKPAETAPVAEAKAEPASAEAKPAEAKAAEPAPAAAEKSAEAAAPAAAEGATSYVVQEGDNLPRIAIDFEVPVARIRELNNLGEGDEVKVGQVLVIPAAQ